MKNYKIKKDGNVIDISKNKTLTQFKRGNYLAVNVNSKKEYVHRLVAKEFIPNPENKKCVNHKNGIKTDNNVENLEWCTHSENTIHMIKSIGTSHLKYNRDNRLNTYYSKLDDLTFKGLKRASEHYNIPLSTLSNQINGRTKNKYQIIKIGVKPKIL